MPQEETPCFLEELLAIYEGFHPDLEKVLLAQITYDTFKQDKLFFSKAEITGQIAEFLADTLNAPPHLDGGLC
ncbi:MAG: hypothetical protein WBA10_13300 [Elainellaceae cyanobacterium]